MPSRDGITLDLLGVAQYGSRVASSRARLLAWLERCALPSQVSLALENPVREVPRLDLILQGIAALKPENYPESKRVIIQKGASPLSRGRIEQYLLHRAEIGVYDIDDGLHVLRGSPRASLAVRAARAADNVIVGSPLLGEWASTLSKNVIHIPTCVEPSQYPRAIAPSRPTIVWIGSQSTVKYLRGISEPLLHTLVKYSAVLKIIGPEDLSSIPREIQPYVQHIVWNASTFAFELSRSTLGIMPVPDLDFERFKCGYKLLQYAASGLPFVASPVGYNRDILSLFKMPSAETVDEWIDAMDALLGDHLSTDPDAIVALVNDRFSYEAWLPRWAAAISA